MSKPSFEEVFNLLHYDPDTGFLFWKKWRQNQVHSGEQAGWNHSKGYRSVKINGKDYQQHRVAWLLYYGSWPNDQVDHVNGDKADNRICNLRAATNSQNQMNRKKGPTNTSGYKGVIFRKTEKKYQARITVNGKRTSLGYFLDPKEAHKAYVDAAKTIYKEFHNVG